MPVEIKEQNSNKWGKYISIKNGAIELHITIDSGPRIVFFSLEGKENLLLQGGNNIPTLFGHHVWFHPETVNIPYQLEVESVVYSVLSDGVRLISPKQDGDIFELSIDIIIAPDVKDVMIVHRAQNKSKEHQTLSLYTNTYMKKDGLLVVPQNASEEESLFPNRTLSLWPYSQLDDPRFLFGNQYVTLRQNTENETPFQFGINNHAGWAAYILPKATFVKRYIHNRTAHYPDFGCSFEAYTDKNYLSMKSISPIYKIEPKETIKHVENWSIFETTSCPPAKEEKTIQAFIENL